MTKYWRIKSMAARKYASLIAVLILLNGIVYFYYYKNNIHLTDGNYIYPLDDTYIHLAMAKNLAFYNTWGVVHGEFSSTSSSPVYTLILGALMCIFGDSSAYPLLVNIFFGNSIIIILFLFLRRNYILFLCSCLFLFTPVLLHIQILSGMEHTLHIFLITAAFILLYKYLENRHKKYAYLFLIVAGLLCLARYESIFFIIPVVLALVLHKQYKMALLTFACGFLPVLLFGLYSMSMGGFFVPNSLLVKGDNALSGGIFYALKYYAGKIYRNVFHVSFFMVPIVILLDMALRNFMGNKQHNLRGTGIVIKKYSFVFVTFTAILLHGFFARFGWLYRYEAYLLALLYISLVMVAAENTEYIKNCLKKRIPSLLSVVFVLWAVFDVAIRFWSSDRVIQRAGKNIYDQQIQMSRFLHAYYNESKVIANDIGAITYYTDIDLLDLV
jgi:4-amino-4-deoxy-L-arabinose transferase-like glycosyltransferase